MQLINRAAKARKRLKRKRRDDIKRWKRARKIKRKEEREQPRI